MKWYEIDIDKLKDQVPGGTEAERIRNAHNEKYGNYDYAQDARTLTQAEFDQRFLDQIHYTFSETAGLDVLIAGSNSGVEVPFFPGSNINAMDLSFNAIKKLRELYPYVESHVGSINDLGFIDNHFHITVCLRTLFSYGVEMNRALDELIRVTKPGGLIIVSVPDGYTDDKEGIIKGMYSHTQGRSTGDKTLSSLVQLIQALAVKGLQFVYCEAPSEIFLSIALPLKTP